MILESPEDTFFLSSRELAKRYEVDARRLCAHSASGLSQVRRICHRSRFISSLESPIYGFASRLRERRELPSTAIRHGVELDWRTCSLCRHAQILLASSRSRISEAGSAILVCRIDLAASLSWHLAYGLMHLGIPADALFGGTGIRAEESADD